MKKLTLGLVFTWITYTFILCVIGITVQEIEAVGGLLKSIWLVTGISTFGFATYVMKLDYGGNPETTVEDVNKIPDDKDKDNYTD